MKKNIIMDIKNVTIAGAGTLGSQIAWQTAISGFDVIVYDAFDKGIEACKKNHQKYAQLFKTRGKTQNQIDNALSRIRFTTKLSEAAKNADIIIESIPEIPDLKKEFYTNLSKIAEEKTIFASNSSTMLPSQFAEYTGRPEKFLALHFANGIWDANIAEIMGHPNTDAKIFDQVVDFAKNIGMNPIPLKKEQSGYVLNSLLIPLLASAQNLYFNGVSDFESIDKAWMISTGAKFGPFGIIDLIGMNTLYNIVLMRGKQLNDKATLERAQKIKEDFIDKGRMGISTGKGFYEYPNPKYMQEDFLK